MPPKKGTRFTLEQIQERRQEQLIRNIDLINFWEILLGLPITNATRPLLNIQRQFELERDRAIRRHGEFLNRVLQFNISTDSMRGVRILTDFFNNHAIEFPLLVEIYREIKRIMTPELFLLHIGYNNNMNYYVVNNNLFMMRLKAIVLGYFLKIPYTVVEGVSDSAGYMGEVLQTGGLPISVFLEHVGDREIEKSARLFIYKNDTKYDLSKYQIFHLIEQFEDQPHCLINCLINALGSEEVSSKKEDLLRILSKTNEITDEFPTSKLTELANLFNIYISVVNPKKVAGKFLDNKYIHNTYPSHKKADKQNRRTISISIINNHYINHEKVLGNIPDVKVSKKLTTTRFICDLINKGNLQEEFNLVNHILNNKVDLCSLNFIKEEGSREFKKKSAVEVTKCRTKNFFRKKVAFLELCSEDIKKKYMDMKTGDYSNYKVRKIKIEDFYCDCEAMFEDKQHIPYSIGKLGKYEGRTELFHNDPNNWDNPDFIKSFLNSFKAETINVVHFHNAKYDYSLLQRIGLGKIINQCEKEGTLYSVEFYYNNRYFIVYDTFKKINRSLKDMAMMFGLKDHKIEHTLHELHIIEAMKKDKLKYEDILYKDIQEHHMKYIADEKGVKKMHILPEYIKIDIPYKYILIDERVVVSKEYLDVVDKKYFENGYFKHKEYYDDYLVIDCVVLKNAMLKFDELMKKVVGEYYSPYTMTISAIADLYACCEGAYKDVFEMTGQLLNFCRKASRGGRVCTAYNKMINTLITEGNIKIEDFDATSLYPSAIVMLKKIFGGIPVGEPLKIPTNELVKGKYGCYKVKILSINKERAIPVFCEEKEDLIVWTNDMIGKEVHMDTFTINDAMVHHNANIEIIEGIYWDKYDSKLCDIVEELFNKRKEYIRLQKEEEAKSNPDIDVINMNKALSEMLKLIMNSIYGKNGLKKSPKNIALMDLRDYQYYCQYNYNKIEPIMTTGIKTLEGEPIYPCPKYNDKAHYNRQHIAMCVLGCSKYIMNKFSMLAEDIGLDVYYTDTDSLHVCTENDKYVETLSKYGYSKDRNGSVILREEYIKKYNEDPIGPNLGQFKSDFKMDGNFNDIYSIGMIALGKKMYCHILRGVNKDTGLVEYQVSCTMKGISERALKYHCDKYYCGNKLALFERIYNGEAIEIDMLGDGTLVSFNIKCGYIEHRKTFPRIISIVNNDIKNLILEDKDLSVNDLIVKYQLPKQTIKKYLKDK